MRGRRQEEGYNLTAPAPRAAERNQAQTRGAGLGRWATLEAGSSRRSWTMAEQTAERCALAVTGAEVGRR